MKSITRSRRPGQRKPKVGLVRLSEIHPSPENDNLYRPADPNDPAIVALADSIAQRGVLEPLVISADNYIVSGHRRYAAAILAGLESVPCRRVKISRNRDPDGFLQLLREHNRQRDKTNSERLREEVVSLNPDDAHAELYEYRRSKAAVDLTPFKIEGVAKRKRITEAKTPMLDAILAVLKDRREYWPLSVRQIHYALLNNPPLKHASKRNSTYTNDKLSYNSLDELVTRARLVGSIPFNAIEDETRPMHVWGVHNNPRPFMQEETRRMFRGYCRNLLQSQPNHIELVGEKKTVASVLTPVASEYTIPLTLGGGYCSLPPRRHMAERFKASGKSTLILLMMTDFDPEGEDIAHSFARSMRDDFDVWNIHPVKVALTAVQVERFKLPPDLEAKKSSSRYKTFVAKYGLNVHELESLPPATLQQLVREAIEAVIDRAAYSAEIAAERDDAVFLAGIRQKVVGALQGLDMEGDE